MRRIHALTGPIVLAALLVTTPRLVLGQRGGDEKSPEITCSACRPGTEIQSDQLGEFLAKNLRVRFIEVPNRKVTSVALRVGLFVRNEGETHFAKYESEAVEVKPGQTYPASTWILAKNRVAEQLAPGFGDSRKITLGRFFVVINHEEQYMPRQCEGATHALQVGLVDRGVANIDMQNWVDMQNWLVCLNVEG